MKKNYIHDDEISILTRAIFYLKEGWGANCKIEDFEPDCEECKAGLAIEIMENSIEYAKEDD